MPAGLILPHVPINKKGQKESIYMRPEAARALEALFAATPAQRQAVTEEMTGCFQPEGVSLEAAPATR